jgi:hypothetical protein
MTASMCLCLDHPGVGNPFLVQSHSPLALTYNDDAPLQSHAAAAAFALMNRDDGACDILIHLNDLQYRYVRRIIIVCVLASDNRRAFEVADKAKAAADAIAAAASPASALQGDARLALLEAATCWGNVSYTCRESSVHKEWASFLSQELVHQGEREREGSLPESPFCDAQQSQAVRSALGARLPPRAAAVRAPCAARYCVRLRCFSPAPLRSRRYAPTRARAPSRRRLPATSRPCFT